MRTIKFVYSPAKNSILKNHDFKQNHVFKKSTWFENFQTFWGLKKDQNMRKVHKFAQNVREFENKNHVFEIKNQEFEGKKSTLSGPRFQVTSI